MAQNFGFGKAVRLTGKNRFSAVFRTRQVRTNRLFLIHHASQQPVTRLGARLGVAVSKRVHRCAVERNRIRRVIRESFRQRRAQLPNKDYVVRARPRAAQADNAALRQALEELWEWFERE